MILILINNLKKFINKFTSRFTNLKNLFTLRSLFILIITLLISFSLRWFLVLYFKYDLYAFKDFCIIGFLVSFIRPLILDVFDIFFHKIDVSVSENLSNEFIKQPFVNSYSRNQYDRPLETHLNDAPSNLRRDYIEDNHKDFIYKAKRRIFWVIWKKPLDEFHSFKDFKDSIRGDIKIRAEIKKDLEKEFPATFRRLRKAKWVINRMGSYRRK